MGTMPHWDEHVEVVFSVLAGFAISEAFDLLSVSNFSVTEIILSVAVFYIVLENWYYLHRELAIFNIESGSEVILYLLSIMTYSCLPFLYGARSSTISGLQPPDWMLLNLGILMGVDTLRKFSTVARFMKNRHDLDEDERKIVGTFAFYAFTGVFYCIFLFAIFAYALSWHMLPEYKALIVVGIWGVIRATDMVLIPKVAHLMERILMSPTVN